MTVFSLINLDTIKILILLVYLIFVLIIVSFSWLYYARTIKATKEIGLHVPDYIRILVKINIVNALLTALLIAFFLLIKMY
jgi:hypothetical protein